MMSRKNLPFLLVGRVKDFFGWPDSTMFGFPLKKELGQAKRIILAHTRRLFGEKYIDAQNKELKDMLISVIPAFNAHLEHSQMIQKQVQ